MSMQSSLHTQSLKSGFDALLAHRQGLDHQIAAERRRSLPDRCELDALEREAARLRGELERYDGLFRTLARGRAIGLRSAAARPNLDRPQSLR